MAVGVFVVGVQVIAIVDEASWTFFHADFQRLSQFFDVEEEQIRFVLGVQAGIIDVTEFFIVFDAACIAKRIVAINQPQWIAIDKWEYSHDQLSGWLERKINLVQLAFGRGRFVWSIFVIGKLEIRKRDAWHHLLPPPNAERPIH